MTNTTDKTIKSKNQPKQTNVIWVDLSGEIPVEKHFINGRWVAIGGGSEAGTKNYSDLSNKPEINSIELSGNKSASDLGLATAAQGTKADNAIPMPTGTDGQILEKDSNETSGVKWVNKPSDGKSAYQLYVDGGGTLTQEQWLASLKANIGAFKFITPTDTTAEAALTTIGSTYASAIGGVSPLQSTLSVILLMNDSNNTKTMMIATQETSTQGIYEFVYAGDLQSAIPSNVLTEDDIDNDFAGGNNKVASAEEAKTLSDTKMDKSYPIYETSPLTATDTQYQTNYFINYQGVITSIPNFGVLGFGCTENQVLLITGSFGSGPSCLGVFKDDNGNVKGLVLQKPTSSPYDNTVVSDYYCEVPSGATKIYVQTNKNLLQNPSCKLVVNTTYRQYSEDILQNETDIDSIQADLEQLQDDFDESIYNEVEYTQTWENVKAYTLVVGSAPSGNIVNQYNSVYIQNLQVSDVVNVYGRSGSSYKQYAKVKNGICVEVVNSSPETNFSLTVDNTYDALVFNNYTGFIANPTATVIKKESVIPLLRDEIDELQDTVDSFDMYTQVETNLEWTPQQFLDAPTIGSVPSFSTDNLYRTIYIQNLQPGDIVNAVFRAGTSSNKKYGAKVKNGLITELIATVSSYSYTFECDGSFDALIFNHYIGWGIQGTATLVQEVLTTEVLSNKIEDLQETVNDIIEQGIGGEFNILCFGNSFTQDTISYIPWLIKECEPNLKLNVYFTYMGGMPISQCLAYISNGTTIALDESGNPTTKYENHGGWDRIYSYNNGEWVEPDSGSSNYHKSYSLYKYEDGANGWVSQSEPTAASVLQMKNWDLITIQQAGSYNYGEWNYYFKPYVYQIQAELQKQVKHNFTLGFLMTHASYAATSEALLEHYNGIVQNATKMLENTPVEIIMPYATALQNARTTYLDRFGAGGHLMGDTAHVSDGVGCLTCAYANTMAILDLIGSKKSIVGSQIYPDAAWLSSHNIPAVSPTIEGLSRYNIWLAQQCAVMATKYPLQLTDMVAKGMCGDTEIEIVNDAVGSSNPILSANNGDSWKTTLIAPDGMTISNVSIIMGSTDVSSFYDSNTKEINIPNVSSKVTITVVLS